MWSEMMIHRGFLLLNEVLLQASRAIVAGDAPLELKQEARWRVAAANELRIHIEHAVFSEGPR
jgi:predicted nuclease with RNAse H fold